MDEQTLALLQYRSRFQVDVPVELKDKLPPTVLRSTEGPKMRKADGSKIPMTWSQKEDTGRIPKMDRTKKVRPKRLLKKWKRIERAV